MFISNFIAVFVNSVGKLRVNYFFKKKKLSPA